MNSHTNIVEKELSYKIMGILFEIHNKLGGEYHEKYYQRAIVQALKRKKIPFKEQISVDLKFDGEKIGKYILDFLIEEKIILEIKAVSQLKPIYFRQVRAYLKAHQLELGILVNFHGDRLTYKRILYPIRVIRTKNSGNLHSDEFVSLAKETVEAFIKKGRIISPPKGLPVEMRNKKTGVFVSLHLKDGSLRGCIGTFAPTRKNIAEEIIQNAISAATQDPRFPPITEKELPNLIYSVDILSTSKSVSKDKLSDPSYRQLGPKKYGLIVSAQDGRRGLLLPNLPGINTVEEQIGICRQKAGINPWEPVSYQIFTVERHN